MQVGHELAGVEVPPDSLLGVVVEGELLPALGAWKPNPLLVLSKHVHALLFHHQVDPRNGPWRLEPKQVAVEVGILHPARLHQLRAPSSRTHGEVGRTIFGLRPGAPAWRINRTRRGYRLAKSLAIG